jgi:hypothetical protein
MDKGVEVRASVAMVSGVRPGVGFIFLDQVEIQFLPSVGNQGFILDSVRLNEPLDRETVAFRLPDPSNSQPVLIWGLSRTAVTELYVFFSFVHGTLFPSPLWLLFSQPIVRTPGLCRGTSSAAAPCWPLFGSPIFVPFCSLSKNTSNPKIAGPHPSFKNVLSLSAKAPARAARNAS